MAGGTLEEYLNNRFRNQLDWFENRAKRNQMLYLWTRRIVLISNLLTPIAIFALVLTSQRYRDYVSFFPILLSAIGIGAYQWEETHGYGPNWAKFRLIAEQLKRQKEFLLQHAGPYDQLDDDQARKRFVEFTEGTIQGTDIYYFTLMIEPEPRHHSEH